MVAVCHSRETGHRLTLRTCGGDDDPVRRRTADLVFADDLPRGVGEVAQVRGDSDVLLHRTADDRHTPVEISGRVDDLLDARDVAGERSDDHAALEAFHDLAERLAHGSLRERVAGILRARGVGQKAYDAVLSEFGQHGEIRAAAVDRRMVELEVAGSHDSAHRCVERHAHRVRDRMADAERLDPEGPDLELVAGIEGQERVVVELVLLDLDAQQAACQRGCVHRHAREVRQDIWQPAHVILVGVCDQERLDLVAVFAQVGDIGDDQVDPEHLLVREHEPAVDHDDVLAVLEHVHVLADFPHSAQGDDAEWSAGVCH